MATSKILGKGTFSVCRDNQDGTVTLTSVCPCKFNLFYVSELQSSRFPKVKHMDTESRGNFKITKYVMKKYDKLKSVKSNLLPAEYAFYKELKKIEQDYHKSLDFRLINLEYLINKSNLHYKRKKLLIDSAYAAVGGNRVAKLGFEIAKRNLAVANGKLILLDVFFDQGTYISLRSTNWQHRKYL